MVDMELPENVTEISEWKTRTQYQPSTSGGVRDALNAIGFPAKVCRVLKSMDTQLALNMSILYIRSRSVVDVLNAEKVIEEDVESVFKDAGVFPTKVVTFAFPFKPEQKLYIPYIDVPVGYDILLVDGVLEELAIPYMPASSIGALIRVLLLPHAQRILACSLQPWLMEYMKKSQWTDPIDKLMSDKFQQVKFSAEEGILVCT